MCGSPARPPGSRILVVDDSVDSAETLGELLRIWGHEVRLAHDGPTAVTAAREYRPEVVLLDIGLPGMDGFAVATALRKEGTAGRMLVALTGYGEQQDRDRAQKAGFDHHLVKPIDPDTLQKLLARK
jgi:two-component system, sensor histidine kinase